MRDVKTATWVGILAAAACLSTGCASNRSHTELMAFLATATPPTGCDEYRVMPPDVLSITARPTDEFNGFTLQVGPDGKGFLPLIGNYTFADKTTDQIAAELTENLLDYYEDVQVTVAIKAYRSQRFFVSGEVARPGVYSFTGNDTLISALAAAGPTRLAQPKRIVITRGLHPLPTVDGVPIDQEGKIKNRTHKTTIDLTALITGEGPASNFMLANNDVIYVPAHPLAKVGLALQRVLVPVRPLVTTVAAPTDIEDAAAGDYRPASY